MDTIETNETSETADNFGVELAKSFALSAAGSIGAVAGFVAIGAVVNVIQNRRKKNRETPITDQEN